MLKKSLSLAVVAATTFMPLAAFGGSATFYSNAYNGSPTASGEPYSPYGYTAAHPSYALGTMVRVTNLNNGRSVDVRINDRCNCSIDLSKAAFQQIGSLSSGVLPVSISPR